MSLEDLLKQLATIQPKEVIIDIDFPERQETEQYINQVLQAAISVNDAPHDLDHYLQ